METYSGFGKRWLVFAAALITLTILVHGYADSKGGSASTAPLRAGSGTAAALTLQPESPTTSEWVHLSTKKGDLPQPGPATQQTASLIMDIDLDGVDDFVIAGRRAGRSVVWYRRFPHGWLAYPIEKEALDIEAGGAALDIDGDGDLDIVMGGDSRSNRVWWWENPHPHHDQGTPWTRREIKKSGAEKHHDQLFGDFDGDGQGELVFWNQDARKLFLAEIPANPRQSGPWPLQAIYAWSGGTAHEGLAAADIDNDGKVDIVGGGRWFKHDGGSDYTPHIIDKAQVMARVAAGQLKEGGWAEVVLVPGDAVGRLKWYEWTGSEWAGHDLLGFDVDHGHSLAIEDVNSDGYLDIFCAEMRLHDGNPSAKMWVFFGDGQGGFTRTEVASGFGNHESKLGDVDGDGDPDILGKPYDWDTPRLDIWLNGGTALPLDQWQRHIVDGDKPWRSVFITAADIDGNGLQDILTGGWWYQNPGFEGDSWLRHAIGAPLRNMAAVYDFDGDGDPDVLGTLGKGSDASAEFAWARNESSGQFTLLDNIQSGDGDFLQGVAVDRFQPGGGLEVALSWHAAGKGVQALEVPANPAGWAWTQGMLSPASQNEALSAGDIDRDGDTDLLLGTQWLRNDGGTWSTHTLHATPDSPDRNRLADLNGDGRLDAVVGFEAVSKPGKLAWYEQGGSATSTWTEHPIATIVGPMSLDVADMDADGDLDVVVGEHNTADPASAALYVFENLDGQGSNWQQHVIHVGDEHHDGAQVVDIDKDGDQDIVSIGWSHDRVLLYENLALTRLPPEVYVPLVGRNR